MPLAILRLRFPLTLCLAIVGAIPPAAQRQAPAQPGAPPAVYDLDKDRELSVPLDGPWRRQVGDNPAWADPAFDDCQWPVVRLNHPWSEQQFSGVAWYRAKILVPANAGPLSIYVPRIYTSFQVFANGQLVTSFGGMPPRPYPYNNPPEAFAIPTPSTGQPYTVHLAIRVWHWPVWADYERGGPYPGLHIGKPALMQKLVDAIITRSSWLSISSILLTSLEALASLTAFFLFLFRRRQREFLWFALLLAASVATRSFSTFTAFHRFGVDERDLLLNVIEIVSIFAEIAFYYRLLDAKRNWAFWAVFAAGVCKIILIVPEYQDRIPTTPLNTIIILLAIPKILWILALLLRRAQQGFQDARLLLAPVYLSKISGILSLTYWIAFTANWNLGSDDWISHTFSWPFDISLDNIADGLFLIGMLAILVRRFTRTQRQEEMYELERGSARTVQQLLIPLNLPPTPGYQIAAVYKPASEVSGDFFQVIPLRSGPHPDSLLIAIGDVSGKGLPAALMVSLLVGTLHTYAETLSSPAEILEGLNRRVHGRSGGGFTTCLIFRADPGGQITFANAGHIAPYVGGSELIIDGGLPLGLSAESAYEDAAYELPLQSQLTVLTDGVVEARDHTGALFGFERTAAISTQSAEAIADAAQAFGQDDDITVLNLTRLA